MMEEKKETETETVRFLRRRKKGAETIEKAGGPTSEKMHALIDRCEARMRKHGRQVECPVKHRFTPGLYIREIFMPAGTLLTSKIHKTEHPYVISKGVVSVWTEAEGEVKLTAPHTGITRPGTRRMLYIHEDTIWTTFHPTELTDVNAIEEAIIETREQPKITNEGKPCLG